MIHFDPDQKIFRLISDRSVSMMAVHPAGGLGFLYWGKTPAPEVEQGFTQEWEEKTRDITPNTDLNMVRRDFADFGHNDLRTPAYLVELKDGSRITEFHYLSHEILPGKPDFPGLPSSQVLSEDQVQTLRLTLIDQPTGLEIDLFYTLYPHRDMLVRRSRIRNKGTQAVKVLKFATLGLDLPPEDYHLVSFGGAWARERMFQERPLLQGTVRLESRRGISSHEMNPFAMVTKGRASEDQGEVFGFALAYSGNWLLEAEVHQTGWLRLNMGLSDFGFQWFLAPGETFTAPECLMAYSPSGFDAISQTYHSFVRDRVCRGKWAQKPRPILINNWEATYFDFKHEDILRIAKTAAQTGVEMMVLDDGWFGKRDKDDSSLGDWFVDLRKLPKGLPALSKEIHDLGLKFGLWFEPEMISPRSRLYEKHPDWCLHVNDRERKTARNQLVLDMTRPEVRDYLFDTIGRVLEETQVDYVKWDMNRSLTEVGSPSLPPERQGEVTHRYCLGVYELMERLNKRFPNVLFEGCAGGGGRFDLGILSYQPQIWSSDNMDGWDRLLIQYGTSFCYPALTQGSHIGSSPNQITRRESPLKWRALLAMSANLGVEADISKWSEGDRKELAGYISLYKEIRPLVQFGDFHRLEAPYDFARTAWMFTSRDQKEALLFIFQSTPPQGPGVKPVCLRGLDPALLYQIKGEGAAFTGEHLMSDGWLPKEFQTGRVPTLFHAALYRLQAGN